MAKVVLWLACTTTWSKVPGRTARYQSDTVWKRTTKGAGVGVGVGTGVAVAVGVAVGVLVRVGTTVDVLVAVDVGVLDATAVLVLVASAVGAGVPGLPTRNQSKSAGIELLLTCAFVPP